MLKKPHQLRVPKYRKHKPTGQAVVTLSGRDFYLGPHGSKTSIAEYDRLIAEWLAAGRRIPHDDPEAGLTINELIVAFWEHCERHYRKNGELTSEPSTIKTALGPVRQLYGDRQATEFGPLALKACRQKLIEAGFVRKSINAYVSKIRRMFKWAVANEMIPADVHTALEAVPGLQQGRSEAVESKPVRPVLEDFVEAIRDYVSPQVWAIVQLQWHTGMRSGEAVIMRAGDITMSGEVWEYVPESHKTEHHDHERVVYLGPRAQEVIRPFLKTDLTAYLFSPRDAEAERKSKLRASRKTAVQPSQRDRRRQKPKRLPGEHYTPGSYRRALKRGIDKANEQRIEEGLPEIPHWFPHRLRHSAATLARKRSGFEAARVISGHKNTNTTEVYAEQDRSKAIEYMASYG